MNGCPSPNLGALPPGGATERRSRSDLSCLSEAKRIFNIHGVGYQLYQGILRQNTQTVVGFVTVLVLVFLAANLIVDLLYAVLDPRIRYA